MHKFYLGFMTQNHILQLVVNEVGLGGLAVIVFVTGPNVPGFKPGQGQWIFNTAFGG
jgi:hypothetical protein